MRQRVRTAWRLSVATLPAAVLTGVAMWAPGDVTFRGGQLEVLAWLAPIPAGLTIAALARWGVRRALRATGRLADDRDTVTALATSLVALAGAAVAYALPQVTGQNAGFVVGTIWGALPAVAFTILDGGDLRRFVARLTVGVLVLPAGGVAAFAVGFGMAATQVLFPLAFPSALVAAHLVVTTAVATVGRPTSTAIAAAA